MRLLTTFLILLGLTGCQSPDKLPAYNYGSANRKKLPEMTMFNHSSIMGEVIGKPAIDIKQIGILVYDGVNTLEAIAPMVVFSELMDVKIDYIAPRKGRIKTTLVDIDATKSITDVDGLDLLVVPGGDSLALQTILHDKAILEWLSRTDARTTLTAGIGSGSFLLGKAGLLKGKRVSLPWCGAKKNAGHMGAEYIEKRYIADGKYVTSGNGTAALDLCLFMVGQIAGKGNLQGAMLDLEYDPEPPLNGGTPDRTPPQLVDQLQQASTEVDGFVLARDEQVPRTLITPADPPVKTVGILVYEGFFPLDAIGPLVVLSQLPDLKVKLITTGENRIKSGRTYFYVDDTYRQTTDLDAVIVPGGAEGTWQITQNDEVLDWLRKTDKTTAYTASVCTGSWVLGAAGLLKGRKASTNWYRAGQMMTRYGAEFTGKRYTRDGKYWTSAGVSAGIDMGFALIEKLAGQKAMATSMLNLAYHPQPPVSGGSPEKTDDLVLDMMHQMYDYLMAPLIRKN
ncbi:DJ-1/PfpI family protein [Arsenicibacter rosenii]|uniref:DJ-1/PfpI domain-containing protein n=1 Tax=Arsenicibacter rosenii TaxID=1750698 RepID=A0A1S2VK27_9BACT|nr:DJ-1/PfpI family protein [Arsenicibacter rosenii]OIN59083.1 hypothetical protein BLX24_12815 [Arsenicibacter rosenii]